MGFWSEIDILMQEGMTKEEAIYKYTNNNNLTIHEAAVIALKELGKESDYLEIYNYIIENKLYFFGAKKEKPEQVLRAVIERKCINSNQSYKTKELLFYKDKNKYGLIEWFSKQREDATAEERKRKIEKEKTNLDKRIHELELKLTKEIEDKSKLEKEKLSLEKEKDELIKYEKEVSRIKSAIEILKVPATQLKDSKKKYEEFRDKFSDYADWLFYISASLFAIIITLLLISFGFDIFEKNVNWALYLIITFPIVFPTILSFLFTRQANIKSKEIEKINKRFILIHEVNRALEALVEINRGKDMDGKTEKIIDKLIDNILDFATEKNDAKEDSKDDEDSKNELLDLNKKVNQIINAMKTNTIE